MYELIMSKFRFRYFWSMLCNIWVWYDSVTNHHKYHMSSDRHTIESQRLPIMLMHSQHVTNTDHSAANIRILNPLRITNDLKITIKRNWDLSTHLSDGIVDSTTGTVSPNITDVHIAIDSDIEFKL